MTDQRSPEWFEQRKNRLTASTVGAILGLSPYMTRQDVIRLMVRAAHGAPTEFQGNVATQHGTFHEDGARSEFEMETGMKVKKCGFFEYEDWLGASPDGLIGDDALWECKAPYGLRNDVKPTFKSIKDMPHYFAQIQIQLWCTRRNYCWFYQWSPHGTSTEKVTWSTPWFNEALPILRQFYAQFLWERDNNAEEHLAPLRKTVDTPAAHKAVQEWDEIKEQMELLEERKKDLLSELVEMGGGSDALIAGRKLTKVEKEGAVSYAKVVKEHLPKLDLTPYRGKPSSFWKLT